MPIELWQGLLIPFAGTTLGAACVFFMRNNLSELVQRALTGFAAGVMVAASVWSLLLPAMEQAVDMGRWSFVPAVVGFWLGILFLLGLDRLIPHLHHGSAEAEGIKSSLGKTTMLTLAVALCAALPVLAAGTIEVTEDVSVSDDYDWTRFKGQNVTLNVYNWGEYISNGSDDSVDVVAAFE